MSGIFSLGLFETSRACYDRRQNIEGRQAGFSINETTDQLSYYQGAQLSSLENIFLIIITIVLLIPITKLLVNTDIKHISGLLPNQIIIIREYIS